jgi:hypothetical protein
MELMEMEQLYFFNLASSITSSSISLVTIRSTVSERIFYQ